MPRKELWLLGGFTLAVVALWCGAAATPTPWADLLDSLHWTLACAGAVLLSGLGWRAARPDSPERVFRFWFTAALTSYLLGQLVYNLESWAQWPPFPAPSDVPYLATCPLILWGYHRASQANPGRDPRNPWLDTSLITLGLVSPLLALYLPLHGQTTWVAFGLLVAYPVFFLTVTAHAVLVFLFSTQRPQPARLVFVLALVGMTASWMGWNYLALLGRPASGTVLNLLFSVSVLTLGWAAARFDWLRTAHKEAPLWSLALPLWGWAAAATGLVVVLATDSLRQERGLFYAMATAGLLLAVVRQRALSKRLVEVATLRARSKELEKALDELRLTQDHLVQSEKLAALGQFIAGIAHDLNSPLGAIRSSTTQIRTLLDERWSSFMVAWESLSPERRQWVTEVMTPLVEEPEYTDGRRERTFRKELATEAEREGRPDAARWATAVTEAGLFERPDVLESLRRDANPYPLLEVLMVYRQVRQLVSVSVHASDRASGVVRALQHYLHVEPAADPVFFDVGDTIRRILPLFQHRVRQGLSIETELERDLIVRAWPDKLTQVWVNLITNALQALGTQGRVLVRSRLDGAGVLVTIEDDGPGIPPEVAPQVFQPFFTTKPAGEGTGLGLDVCRRVVEEAGGTISFHSRPGCTVFEVRLPEPS